jgi:hypothetical protein
VPNIVGKAGRMGEQLAQRYRLRGWPENRFASGIESFQNLERSKFRQMLCGRFVQRQLTLFDKLHRSGGRNRLGHGSDGENGLGRDWHTGDGVACAECTGVSDRAGGTGHGGDRRNLALFQPGAQNGVYAVRSEEPARLRSDGKCHAAKFSAGESVHTFGCNTKGTRVRASKTGYIDRDADLR